MADTISIPIGAIVDLRGSKELWKVISHVDERNCCRHYSIMSVNTGEIKRAFKHELFERSSSRYKEVNQFLREQGAGLLASDFNDDFMTELFSENPEDIEVLLSDTREKDTPQPDELLTKPSTSRFKIVTEEDIDHLASKRTEPTTNNMTKWAVKLFKEWMVENQFDPQFEKMIPAQLDAILQKFYVSLQTKKGKEYSKASLIGVRAGINRHVTSPPYSRQINLMKDRDFMKSNQVLFGIVKELKRAGKDTSQHKDPVTKGDIAKLYDNGFFNVDNPKTLQNKVLFDIMAHFGRRGREGLAALRKNSFTIKTDDNGHKYVCMAYNEADKTHHGIDSRESNKQPRMYETSETRCPVQAFVKYTSKLNVENESFFQKPLQAGSNSGWYGKQSVGVNTLYNFMSRLSSEAGLSKHYTNHCIRAMVASTLCQAGVSSTGIMSVTGHRNVQSLKSYIRPSDDQRRSISNILTGDETVNETGFPTHSLPASDKQLSLAAGSSGSINHGPT